MTPRSALAATALLAALAPLAGCSPQSPGEALGLSAPRPSIVLVTLDTTRADRLSCHGGSAPTPRLAALAGGGVRFAHAQAVAPLTLPAHTSMLTGLYPPRHGSRDNGVPPPSAATTLAERLQAAGYTTGAFVSSFVLDRRFGLGRGFATYDDGPFASTAKLVSMATLERKGDATVKAALAWSAAAKRPFFLWVHLFDPHAPYQAPEPWTSHVADPYDAEVAFADHCLGTLVDGLRAQGLGADALVAVAGDHGEGLGDHGESSHGVFLYESTLHVPLVFATLAAAAPGRVVETRVSGVDVAPTLLDLAGLPLPEGLDGRSLGALVAGRPDAPRPIYAESLFGRLHFGWAELRALTDETAKYIDAPRPELYDLGRDPGERQDLIRRDPHETERLRRLLADLAAELGPGLEAPGSADAETLARLAALGYVGAGRAPVPSGADPKDKVGVAEALVEARRRLEGSRFDEGITVLEQLLGREPDFPDALFLLGWAHLEKGEPSAAAERLGRVLALSPRYPLASYHLALALDGLGDRDGALAAYDAAVALDPSHGEAHAGRAQLLAQATDLDGAESAFRRALELTPASALLHARFGAFLLRRQQFAAATAELEEAVRLNPRVPVAHFNLALLAERGGRPDEAERRYRAAIAADPDEVKARVNLAVLLGERGEAGEAEALLVRALEIDPGLAPGWAMLARLRAARGDRRGADEALARGR